MNRFWKTITSIVLCLAFATGGAVAGVVVTENVNNAQQEETNAEYESQISSLSDSLASIQSSLEQKESEIVSLTTQIQDLDAENSDLEIKVTELENTITEKEIEIAQLEADATIDASRIAELESEIEELETEKTNLQAQIDEKDSELANLTSNLNSKQEEYDTLYASYTTLQASYDSLYASYASLQTTNSELEAQIAELQARIEELEAELGEEVSVTVLEDDDGYYVEMGYYPTTYAGLVSDCSFTSTGETFTLGDGTEYDIYTDGTDEYIQYTPSLYSTSYTYSDGTTTISAISYYKLEPIQWQVLGVYTAGATTEQTSTSSLTEYTGQELGADEQLAVQSRLALESMAWYAASIIDSSINYNNSDIYSWLGSFYTNVLSDYSSNIVARTIDYNTTASCTSLSDYYDNYTTEYVWLMSYTEASTWYTSFTARLCSPSDFALATGAYLCTDTSYTTSYRSSGGTCYWWLRSSYFTSSSRVYAGRVDYDGFFSDSGVTNAVRCVRPALLVNL